VDFTWSDSEKTLRAELRAYVDEHQMPGWVHTDRDLPTAETVAAARAFCQGLAERGLLTPAWSEADGGRGASKWAQIVVSEELRSVGEPRGPQYTNVNWLGPAISQLGTDEQRKDLLRSIAAGDSMWCQGFSEPDAGSDLSALRTSAVREGDFYVVNGQKIWTSYAHAADHCFLLVRTAKSDNPRAGISVLLVPMDLNGIEVREIPTLGIHHMLHEVFFTDVHVPAGCLLGDENEGWTLIRTLLANERAQVALHEEVDRGLDQLVDEALAADVDFKSDSVWEILGSAAAATAAGRVLNYVAVQAWSDGSSEYSNLAAIYKASTARMTADAAKAHTDLLGAEALLESARGDYQLISAIESGIGGGSLEMQLNSIAWYVLGLPKR
jgi:alkylation response protein AidB-like acyl-CoA dehydrogenase